MAQVTLVNPNRMKPGVAPIALDYVAESLAAAGHEVGILDLCFSHDWEADVDSHFHAHQPDLTGLSVRNTDDCYFASQDFFIPFFKNVIRRIQARTDAPIVLGGSGLSVAPETIMDFCEVEYALPGEGEFSLPPLASCVTREEEPVNVPGLVYRAADGLRRNPIRWMDLADLPLRSRSWLDNRRYFEEGGQAGIETKRGCDRACIYCADPLGKGRVCRLRPPAHIVAETRALVNQGVDCFHLCDSEFNVPFVHAEAVCRAIIESDIAGKFGWYTYASPVPFTDELATLMKRAGCLGIDFGADSGDDVVLRALGRDFTSNDLRRTAEICHRHGITFMYDLLIGGPGETSESVKRTFDLMKEMCPSRVGVAVGVRIYDGTALAGIVRREGVSPANGNLDGVIEGNDCFLAPIYYLSEHVGGEAAGYVGDLVAGDPMFLYASTDEIDANYNYNDNSTLVQAIRKGHRGAYWDILRKVQEGEPP